jgi:hypothetical protein
MQLFKVLTVDLYNIVLISFGIVEYTVLDVSVTGVLKSHGWGQQQETDSRSVLQSRTIKARYFAAVGIPIRDMTGTPPEARK